LITERVAYQGSTFTLGIDFVLPNGAGAFPMLSTYAVNLYRYNNTVPFATATIANGKLAIVPSTPKTALTANFLVADMQNIDGYGSAEVRDTVANKPITFVPLRFFKEGTPYTTEFGERLVIYQENVVCVVDGYVAPAPGGSITQGTWDALLLSSTALSTTLTQGLMGPGDKFKTVAIVTLEDFGGKADCVSLIGYSTTVSGTACAIASGTFVAGDVGKSIAIVGAGVGGLPHVTTIAGYTSPTTITLATVAPTALVASVTKIVYGTNNSPALQSFMDAISGPVGMRRKGRIIGNPKSYMLTTGVTLTQAYSNFEGDGKFNSVFDCSAVVGHIFNFTAGSSSDFSPRWKGFKLTDQFKLTTGDGINVTSISSPDHQMSLFDFDDIEFDLKGTSIRVYNCFAGRFNGLNYNSSNDHGVVALMGNSTTMTNCYALNIPAAGKTGYRLAGQVHLVACNGVNNGDIWGVFGSDPTGTDGYQTDFPVISYPSVSLSGCNVESFGVKGIYNCAPYQMFEINGGKIDRNGPTSAYHSLIHFKGGANTSGSLPKINTTIIKGTGVPNGGAGLSNAWIYSDNIVAVEDVNNCLINQGIPGVYIPTPIYAGIVPFISSGWSFDQYQNASKKYSALTARRFTLQTNFYAVLLATPVGVNQNLDITGFSKITLKPVAAASISTISCVQTLGVVSDHGRNGYVKLMFGNTNCTVKHNPVVNGISLAGGADIKGAIGDWIELLWSDDALMWVQQNPNPGGVTLKIPTSVGGTANAIIITLPSGAILNSTPQLFIITIAATNTGPVTLADQAGTVVAVTSRLGALTGGELQAGVPYLVSADTTNGAKVLFQGI
jgi:hypothetical protein